MVRNARAVARVSPGGCFVFEGPRPGGLVEYAFFRVASEDLVRLHRRGLCP